MRVALHYLCLWLPAAALALAPVPRRSVIQRVLGPPAAALVVAQPAATAAAAPPTPTPRSAALDAAGYAYALVRANDGGAVVTLDLDRTQRVRTAVYLYETRAQADAVRRAVMSARDKKAAPLALARVPLGEAAALVLAPPAKREGVPGYFCHRLLVEQSRLAAAKRITGISDLGDRFFPLFYVDDDTGSREASGGVQDVRKRPEASGGVRRRPLYPKVCGSTGSATYRNVCGSVRFYSGFGVDRVRFVSKSVRFCAFL